MLFRSRRRSRPRHGALVGLASAQFGTRELPAEKPPLTPPAARGGLARVVAAVTVRRGVARATRGLPRQGDRGRIGLGPFCGLRGLRRLRQLDGLRRQNRRGWGDRRRSGDWRRRRDRGRGDEGRPLVALDLLAPRGLRRALRRLHLRRAPGALPGRSSLSRRRGDRRRYGCPGAGSRRRSRRGRQAAGAARRLRGPGQAERRAAPPPQRRRRRSPT